jgi:ribonucleotide monophosphatase NagD (HAD superfamily)
MWYSGVFAQRSRRRRTLVVDLDGTIAHEEHEELKANEPMEGVREALQRLSDAGYEIVIFTCRMNRKDRPPYVMALQKAAIEDWLKSHQIPFDRIDEGYEGKPRGDFIIDNKALQYNGHPNDWENICNYVLSRK